MTTPKIVAIGSPKGGVMKTTLAVHFAALQAARNQRVLLVDADENLSAYQWAEAADLDLDAAPTDPKAISKLRNADYDLIVVDLPGARSTELAALIKPRAIDLLVCPTRPGVMDIAPLANLLDSVKVPALTVLTFTDPRWTQGTENARAQLTAEPFAWNVARTPIRRSQAWADARDAATLVTNLRNAPTAYADCTGIVRDIQEAIQ